MGSAWSPSIVDDPASRLLNAKKELSTLPRNFTICRELILVEINRLQQEVTVQNGYATFDVSPGMLADPQFSMSSSVWSPIGVYSEYSTLLYNIPEFPLVPDSWTQPSHCPTPSVDVNSRIVEDHPVLTALKEDNNTEEDPSKTSLKIFVPVKDYPGVRLKSICRNISFSFPRSFPNYLSQIALASGGDPPPSRRVSPARR